MIRAGWAVLAACVLVSSTAHAQTLTGGPISGQTVLKPETDYATAVWQDAWDMGNRTDIGWLTWGADASGNIASQSMVGCTSGTTGCSGYRFTASGAGANIFLLDTWQPNSAPIGKNGKVKTIDTTKYKYLLVKMKVTNGVAASEYGPLGFPQMQVMWSRDSIYTYPPGDSNFALVGPNSGTLVSLTGSGFLNPAVVIDDDGIESSQYQILAVRLDQIHWWNASRKAYNSAGFDEGALWGSGGNTGDSFFLVFPNTSQLAARYGAIDIAWARLTTTTQTSQTITWTGGPADVVISPNAGCSGYTVLAENQTSPFAFDFGALPPGDYHVGLRPPKSDGPGISESVSSCSGGTYFVPSLGTLTFSSPTDEGSTDDYATTFFGKPWDSSSLFNFDQIHDMSGGTIDPAFPAQRPDGTNLGNIRVLKGTSPNPGDAWVYGLWFNVRGLDNRIDPSRYRILTWDLGVDAQRNINAGSISRIVWHVNGDGTYSGSTLTRVLENVGDDLVIRHLKFGTETSSYILDRLQVDMKNRGQYPVEVTPDPPAPSESSPSRSGWTSACVAPDCPNPAVVTKPGVDGFRLDFHEFTPPTLSYMTQAKLAALEKTTSNYTISWTATVPSSYSSRVLRLFASRQTVSSPPSTLPNQPAAGLVLTPTSSCDPSDGNLIAINGAGTALPAGTSSDSFVWNVGAISTGTLANGAEIYICGVVQGTLQATVFNLASQMTMFPIEVNRTFVSKPRLNFDRSTIRFSAVRTSGATPTFTSKTPDQVIGITQTGSGTATWRVESILDTTGAAVSYITATPTSGTGSGTTTISLVPTAALPLCSAKDGLGVIIKITSDGTTQNEPQYIRAYVTMVPGSSTGGCVAPGAAPTGSFDTPGNGASGVIGSIPVTGWAMDDIAVQEVQIWRNCVESIDRPAGACAQAPTTGAANYVFIGRGAFLSGARPDVEALFPTNPIAYRAGWGYLMATNALPHLPTNAGQGGQGQFTLYAFAIDVDGHAISLGSKVITLNNDNATIPFGAIDTPDQGMTVPESRAGFDDPNAYPNFGWAMTQSPKCLTTSGSTASWRVYIDGVSRTLNTGSNWFMGLTRPDIAGAYPGRCNTNDALAVYYIDSATLGLPSGLHTIGWDAIDNGGNIAGIGSRFFNLITGSALLGPSMLGPSLGKPADSLDVVRLARGEVSAERQRKGYPIEPIVAENGRRTLVADEIERVQIELPKAEGASEWQGYQVTHNELGLLPMGSTLDGAKGTFYWQPVAGFLGSYDFVFVRRGSDGQQERVPVRVTYRPKTWAPLNASAQPGSDHSEVLAANR